MTEFLNNIFKYDNAFIEIKYRHEQKQFMLDVMECVNYINNQKQFDMEANALNKDMEDFGLQNEILNDKEILNVYHLVFKELRLKILYINTNGYTKMKMRTLISRLGYKKRSPQLVNYIYDCLLFYHISVTLKENVDCDIESVELDRQVIFRVI